jgi:hypothetical protein
MWVSGDETREKATDPYCPSVWATTPDDIPLIVKGCEEFPARNEGSRVRNVQFGGKTSPTGQGDTHEYAIHGAREPHERRYWKDDQCIEPQRLRQTKSIRTKVVSDLIWITIIHHDPGTKLE